MALRNMIASGELKAGERIAEIPTAEALGVSRMPVRTALRALEQEGLVVQLGARGYAARSFSSEAVRDSVQVRGVLEGLAAAQAAQRGVGLKQRRMLQACLVEGDALFAKGHLVLEDFDIYHAMNQRFHDVIISASGNAAIALALARNNSMPFGGASAMALDERDLDGEFQHLHSAHLQHHAVYGALMAGDAVTAETLMRQHANAAVDRPHRTPVASVGLSD